MTEGKIHTVYLIGIGGIGMSALARWYLSKGYKVAGYDKTPTTLTEQLKAEGIDIHFEDGQRNIPDGFTDPEVLVVYTPAVPDTHEELNYFRKNGNRVIKRSEALGEITRASFTIAIAGTHGKTTTSSMVAHIFKNAGANVFAFVGGITQNYHTNVLFGSQNEAPPVMVVEADEYDRSFLRLHPDMAIITAMDPDHLDIYKEAGEFAEAFHLFAGQIKPGGILVYKDGLPVKIPAGIGSKSFGSSGNFKAVVKDNQSFLFDIVATDPAKSLEDIQLQVPGIHNIHNALAAYIVALEYGIAKNKIREGLLSFKGVKRRFEYHVKNEKYVYIDDYAHHPTEIAAVLTAVRSIYPGKKLTVVFQPHLYSRTKDFMEGFAETLSVADEVLLLEIYPARELPLPGITAAALLKRITAPVARVVSKESLLSFVAQSGPELLVTMGAGDIDQLVAPLKEIITAKNVDK